MKSLGDKVMFSTLLCESLSVASDAAVTSLPSRGMEWNIGV